MLDTNTNKIMWVAMAVGVVAILGLSTMTIFPDALSNTQTQITKINKSFNDKTKDISNDDGSDADKNTTTPVNDNTTKEATSQIGIYTVTTDSTGYSSYTVDNSKAGFQYQILSDSDHTVAITGGGVIGNTLTIPDYLIIGNTKYKVTTIQSCSYWNYEADPFPFVPGNKVINHIAKTVTSIGPAAFSEALAKGQTIYVNRATGDMSYLTREVNAPFRDDNVTIKYYD